MIVARQIGLRYTAGPEVLSDISCTLEAGSFHYLTGSSGSGKTSLMHLFHLGKLPTRGELYIQGHNVAQASRFERAQIRSRIGMIFQNFRLLPHLNLYDNIALPLRLNGLDENRIKNAVDDMVEWIGLTDCKHAFPALLSGGQQQRVAIARAVITKPKFLLADEPTGSLDDIIGEKILVLFEELNKSGTAILVATHNKNIIKRHPHPELKIKNGHLVT